MSRQAAISELKTRLARISVANGFQTDAGLALFVGERPALGPADPEASLVVLIQEDEPGYQGENVVSTVPVDVQVIVKADITDPWETVEAAVADIKTAVETDHDLGGTTVQRGLTRGVTRPLERDPGSEYTGVAVGYRLMLGERWGAP